MAGIAGLLLANRLVRVRRNLDASGLSSVLVVAGETRAVLGGPTADVAHPKEVKEATGSALHVLRS